MDHTRSFASARFSLTVLLNVFLKASWTVLPLLLLVFCLCCHWGVLYILYWRKLNDWPEPKATPPPLTNPLTQNSVDDAGILDFLNNWTCFDHYQFVLRKMNINTVLQSIIVCFTIAFFGFFAFVSIDECCTYCNDESTMARGKNHHEILSWNSLCHELEWTGVTPAFE